MGQSRLIFTLHFFLHLISGSISFFFKLHLFFQFGFLLLCFNHSSHHLGLRLMLILLMIKHFLGLVFFIFSLTNFLFHLFNNGFFILEDFPSLLFFDGLIMILFLCGHILLLHVTLLFFVFFVHVSFSLRNDVTCFLTGLVYFLICTIFFHTEETNSIFQQF